MREINLTDRERSLVAEAVDRMRATALETWNGVPAEALAAERKRVREALLAELQARPLAAYYHAAMLDAVNRVLPEEGPVPNTERESVLRFLEGFREEARGNPVSTYLDEMILSRMIGEIRDGNHVAKGGE